MAFNKDKKAKDMNSALEEAKSPDLNNNKLSILKRILKKKSSISIYLRTISKKKIATLANENGYSSSSEFLNELIKSI